ncbi:nucleophile aminohydrolase, partial [Haematococcus lacustris]
MCRLMAFIGERPALIADVVLWPQRSIIKQSYDARERKGDPALPFHLGHGNLNGDGFGIGWFGTDERRDKDPTPCVFTSITPAWNNENLARLSCKIMSPLIFAHVRAAYPGMPVSEQNCHPFAWGRYLWMHNGVVGGFLQIKRALLSLLSDEAYNCIQSFHSDSAVSFALFLHHLPDMARQQPPEVLLQAMEATIATISALQQAQGITATSLLNYVVSDGTCLIATRFVNPANGDAASLYYAEGASFQRAAASPPAADSVDGCGSTVCAASLNPSSSSVMHEASYELMFGERGSKVAFIASEPITASNTDWVAVSPNTTLIITREKGGFMNIMRAPIAVAPLPPQAPPGSLPGNPQGGGLQQGGGSGQYPPLRPPPPAPQRCPRPKPWPGA